MSDVRFVPNGIVTLTTDFGTSDGYVGAMKGVVLRHAPGLALLDIAHGIEPQNVSHGAAVLRAACPEFPAGTVHLCVVDPGVGTARAPMVVLAGGHAFVGPDNGLTALASAALGGVVEARRIDATGALASVLPRVPSNTFHGRDVFAPTAAALASGHVAPADVGPPLDPTPLPQEPPVREADAVRGHVAYVDRFGNAVTNVSAEDLSSLDPDGRSAEAAGRSIDLVATYGDVEEGRPCALVGSEGFLEIAIRAGNAAASLGLTTGSPVRITNRSKR